jgi:probable HAF family extracellular repeat protein
MPTYTYTLFDDPLGVGRFGGATHARGINSAGQIVGYIDGANGSSQGFILSNGIYSPLDDPLGTQGTFPSGINSTGQIVGTYQNAGGASHGSHGFLYSGGGYLTLDHPLALPGTTHALGINDAGEVVGYYDTNSPVQPFPAVHGFLYSGGTYYTLDDPSASPPPGGGTVAYSINNAGQVLGRYSDASGTHIFLFSGGVYTTLPNPPSAIQNSTFPYGINDAGQIVGTYQTQSRLHSFLYSGGVFTDIDVSTLPDTDPGVRRDLCVWHQQQRPDRRRVR